MKKINDNENIAELYLPALRAQMGSWYYYIAQMRMADIANKVSFATEVHQSDSLNELIQRRLSNRSAQIAQYLLTQEQRFFNAFVFGIYGGQPRWYELNIESTAYFDAEKELPNHVENALGFLALSGEEKIFAIDGQHRVAGIKRAVKEDVKLGEELVATIFVGHKTDKDGIQQTRRLFTTLNKYAKAINKLDRIALDEDDIIAITTRSLVENHALFKGKIGLASGNSLTPSDTSSFTTIGTLYDVLDLYLKNKNTSAWNNYKLVRPDPLDIDRFITKATTLWDTLIIKEPSVQKFSENSTDSSSAAKYRDPKTGGHLLFRPVGLLVLTRALRKFIDTGLSLDEAFDRIVHIPMDLSNNIWTGLLWDPSNTRMLTSSENQKTAEKLVFYTLGGDLSKYQSSKTKLRKELAGILNKSFDTFELPTQFIQG